MTTAKNYPHEFTRALIAGNTARAAAVAYLQAEPCPEVVVDFMALDTPVHGVVEFMLLKNGNTRRFSGMTRRDVVEIAKKFAPNLLGYLPTVFEKTERAWHIEHMLELNPAYAPADFKNIARRFVSISREKRGWTVTKSDKIEKDFRAFGVVTKRDAERLAATIILSEARRLAERFVKNGYTGYEDY